MVLLSVIIPFFNTFCRSEKVLNRVSESLDKYSNVEFILVDDGSKDNTLINLKNYFSIHGKNNRLKIITQENKGPGSARNTGLAIAQGHYVWFVDSDDDFYLDKIYSDLVVEENDLDFIDYNYIENNQSKNSMDIDAGIYSISQVDLYSRHLGRIWTKIFKRQFFIKNGLKYPENCIYEDNYFIYALPFFIKNFKKSEKIAYLYEVDVISVTREKGLSPRFFDRLLTSVAGLHFLNENGVWESNQHAQQRFKEIFLYSTAKKIILNLSLQRLKTLYYVCCTYNFLEKNYSIGNHLTENSKNKVIDFIRFYCPNKNYMPYFVNLNKEEWKIK